MLILLTILGGLGVAGMLIGAYLAFEANADDCL